MGACSRKTHIGQRVAEELFDEERSPSQYFGDLDALDRLEALAGQDSPAWTARSAQRLFRREVASSGASLRRCARVTSRARPMGGTARGRSSGRPSAIDQACGVGVRQPCSQRASPNRHGERVDSKISSPRRARSPISSVSREADRRLSGRRSTGIRRHFAIPAGVGCFQLGMLWGDTGTKRTSLVAPHTSAFGGKADMTFCTAHVRF